MNFFIVMALFIKIHVSKPFNRMESLKEKNRHLLEVARLMFTINVSKQFWGDAVLTAAYLINRMPSRVLQFHSPWQLLLESCPSLLLVSSLSLKVFSCTAFVHVNSNHRSKLDPRSIKYLFLGHSSTKKGYKCFSPVTKKVYITLDVTFFENQSFYSKTHIQGENLTI